MTNLIKLLLLSGIALAASLEGVLQTEEHATSGGALVASPLEAETYEEEAFGDLEAVETGESIEHASPKGNKNVRSLLKYVRDEEESDEVQLDPLNSPTKSSEPIQFNVGFGYPKDGSAKFGEFESANKNFGSLGTANEQALSMANVDNRNIKIPVKEPFTKNDSNTLTKKILTADQKAAKKAKKMKKKNKKTKGWKKKNGKKKKNKKNGKKKKNKKNGNKNKKNGNKKKKKKGGKKNWKKNGQKKNLKKNGQKKNLKKKGGNMNYLKKNGQKKNLKKKGGNMNKKLGGGFLNIIDNK